MPTDVEVDQFAAGNGTTDDTQAIRQAIATGRHLRFTRGKTYLYSGQLGLQAGQIVYGNGATLKRRGQSQTTTSSSVTAGQTKQITVSDASGLAVGMDIVLRSGSTYDPNNRTITQISGNTITVDSAFGISSSGGADVFSSSHGLYLKDDCRVYDLVMDGNRGAVSYVTWENAHEIHMQGLRSLVSGCFLKEVPGEGIYLERDQITVTDCTILNCNGNGVHISHSNRSLVDRVRVQNANLLASLAHNDGCVFLGNNVNQLTVTSCYLENGVSGIGSWDQTDNSELTFTDNTIVSCRASAMEGLSPLNSASANVVIANNRIYDSKVLYAKAAGGSNATVFPSHVVMAGNYLRNTRVEICARWLDFTDNILEDSGTTATLVDVTHSKQVLVRGNNVAGGRLGISVSGTSDSVLVQGNTLSGQADGAIVLATPGMVNTQAVGNNVTGESSAAAAYRGITVSGKELARGNMVNVAAGEAGILANSDALVKDNVVRKGAATYSIRMATGSTGVLVKDNEVTAPVSNGGGAGNVEAGTVIIPA
jgi:hypothetical protein